MGNSCRDADISRTGTRIGMGERVWSGLSRRCGSTGNARSSVTLDGVDGMVLEPEWRYYWVSSLVSVSVGLVLIICFLFSIYAGDEATPSGRPAFHIWAVGMRAIHPLTHLVWRTTPTRSSCESSLALPVPNLFTRPDLCSGPGYVSKWHLFPYSCPVACGPL